MGKSKGPNQTFMYILVAVVVILAGALYVNSTGEKTVLIPPPSYPPASGGGGAVPPAASVVPAYITDNSGTLSLSVQNQMNTTETQFLGTTTRIYKKETPGQLFNTVTTIATGTGRGTLTIDKYTPAGTPQEYIYVVTAWDANRTSTSGTFTAAESVEVNALVSNQSSLIFKVYDNEARAYLYKNGEDSTNFTTHPTGNTFESSVNASHVGVTVGAGGYYDFTVYLSTNGTNSTTTQFEDQALFIAIDAGDLSDWQKPTISIPGAIITELTPGNYNDKIKNDGFDFVYSVTKADGKPYHIDSAFTKMAIQQYAKAGVNPSDDISVRLYTSGIYVHTLDQGVGISTHKDDSSQTAVFTPQDVTFSIV